MAKKILQQPLTLSQVMRDSTRESGDVEKEESDESTTASSQPWSVDPTCQIINSPFEVWLNSQKGTTWMANNRWKPDQYVFYFLNMDDTVMLYVYQ